MATGGSVMIIPSPTMDISSFNKLFQQINANPLVGINDKQQQLSKINYQEAVFQDVFEQISDNIDLPYSKLIYTFDLSVNTGKEDLLIFNDGNAFLSKFSFGSGKMYMLTSPLNEDYTNLPLHSIFIPMVYKISWLSQGIDRLYYNLGSGNKIILKNKVNDQDKIFKLVNEELEYIPVQRQDRNGLNLILNEELNKAGFYKLMNDESDFNTLAFNYERKESYLEYLSEEDFGKIQKENIAIIDDIESTSSGTIGRIARGTELWKLCLIFALIFLAAEVLLLRFALNRGT